MKTLAPRRHALLFVLAFVLPCAGLVALGVRMIADGEELARAREADNDRRELQQVGSELLARLERLKLEEAGRLAATPTTDTAAATNRDVALVGTIREGRLVLPWELEAAPAQWTEMLARSPYADALAAGEREEAGGRLAAAIEHLKRAVAQSATPAARDYARLLLARVYVKCSCPEDALPLYRALLDSPTLDDQGVPLALYAARQLLGLRRHQAEVLEFLDRRAVTWVTAPTAAYLSRDLLATLGTDAPSADQRDRARALLARLSDPLLDIERALKLQRDWPSLEAATTARGPDPVWLPYDSAAWFVSRAPSLAGLPPLAIAARARPALDAVSATSNRAALTFSITGTAGESVGPAFPGLRVSFGVATTGRPHAWTTERRFYILALFAVIGVTLVGGAFFWWDVQRELRIAELRSQFVASVSHELRTPLTAIRMFAETMQMDRPLDGAARSEYLETIVSESERLTRLVNNVLDFSRIERGDKVYQLESTSLPRIVRGATRAMHYPLARQGFHLNVDVPNDIPAVRADPDAISQAVLNLLNNAVKYSGDARDIDLTVARVNGHVVIRVSDHGIGIAHSEHRRIFQRFYRASSPENDRIPGTGLGLALVDHIVTSHGGHVGVTSAPGEGSTFEMYLPLAGPREVGDA